MENLTPEQTAFLNAWAQTRLADIAKMYFTSIEEYHAWCNPNGENAVLEAHAQSRGWITKRQPYQLTKAGWEKATIVMKR